MRAMEPRVNRNNKASLTNLCIKMENWGSKYADLEVKDTPPPQPPLPGLHTCKNQHGHVVSTSDSEAFKTSSLAGV